MRKPIYGIFLMVLVTFSTLSLGLNITTKYFSKIDSLNAKTQKIESESITFGAWIIIGGDRWDHDKLNWIKYTCNKTFEILKNCGYSDSEIFYLYPAPGVSAECPYADSWSIISEVKYAIENWAVAHVGAGKALGIYMMDHGGFNEFPIPGTPHLDDWVNATLLKSYLNTYETKSGNNQIVIVIDACYSGSFIDDLSKTNRIIVTSTADNLEAYGTPPIFFENFWSDVLGGKSIAGAFETATTYIKAIGYGNSQKPWIDDNHDAIGHTVDAMGNLPNGGDGTNAISIWIKKSPSQSSPVVIQKFPLRFFIPPSVTTPTFWVKIYNTTPIRDLRLRIRPPGWSPPPTPPPPAPDYQGNNMSEDFNVTYVEFSDYDNDGNYTGVISPFHYYGKGEYKIDILCRSEEGDFISDSTSFYVNDDGTPPTDSIKPTVRIENPVPNAHVSGLVQIVADGDDDQALDRIELYIDGVLVNTTLMPDYYPYPLATYNWDTALAGNEIHTIKAIAYDKAGNNMTAEVIVHPPPGGIPSFSFSLILTGCILVVTIAYLLKVRRKVVQDLSFL